MLNLTQRFAAILAVILLISANWAVAEDMTPAQKAWDAATKVAKTGPSEIPFDDQALLRLPEGMAFIPVTEATALMRLWGNSVDGGFQGLVVSTSNDEQWVVTIDQVAEGYVKDEEARNWNADELLQSLKDGTEAQNTERLKMGLPALDVTGWVQPPNYEPAAHRLVWSLKAVDRGAAADAEATVNYNTYALGRDGYFTINLLTGSNRVEQEKPIAQRLLSAFNYNPGKRYEDFNAETDHIAEYGIAALIGGVAAKKLGLLAVIGVFLAKFAKVILIAAAVFGGVIFKFFRRSPKTEA